MNRISIGVMAGRTFSTAKFDRFTFSEKALLLKYRNKQQIEISFEEIDKVYIKKYKLNPIVEFVFISFPFLLVFMTIQYFASGLLILASIIIVLPALYTVINFKWYRFNVHLKDGSFFSKRVRFDKKTESIIAVSKIKRECLQYNNAHLTLA